MLTDERSRESDASLAGARRRFARKAKPDREQARFGLILLIPALVIFLVVIAYPVVYGISRAFFAVNRLTLSAQWVGFANFAAELFGPTAKLLSGARLSIIFAVGTTLVQLVVGVAAALLLNRPFFGRSLARGLAIFPYMVPIVVAVLVWKWMLNDQLGIVNHSMLASGLIDAPIAWFNQDWAMTSVILIGAWRYFPFIVLVVLARLQSIPRALYDAARLDGASSWAQFWDVTLPQLRTVLLVTVGLRIVWEFNDFDLIALATNGGPAGATETLPLNVYSVTFFGAGLGRGAALSTIILTVILLAYLAIHIWNARRAMKQER